MFKDKKKDNRKNDSEGKAELYGFIFATTAMALFISKDIISHAPNAIEPLLFIRNKVINIVYRAAADAEQSRPAPNSSLFPFYTENPMMLEKTNQIANMRDAYRSNFNFSSSHNLSHKSYSAKSRISASNMPMENSGCTH